MERVETAGVKNNYLCPHLIMFKSFFAFANRLLGGSGKFGFLASVLKPEGRTADKDQSRSHLVILRRTDDINNIESEGRYTRSVLPVLTDAINCIETHRYWEAVMPRRTDAINNIESEGRYECGRREIKETVTTVDHGYDTENTRGHSYYAVSSLCFIPVVLFCFTHLIHFNAYGTLHS